MISADPYTFTEISVLGSTFTEASGINNLGQIVGSYGDESGRVHGFVETNGAFTAFDVPGALRTHATAINDFGQIVGYYATTPGPGNSYGFLNTTGNFSTIVDPNQPSFTFLSGINDVGQIVGNDFVYSDGVFTRIAVLGDPNTSVRGINDSSDIVGQFNFPSDGFLGVKGSFTIVQNPDGVFTFANAVNNSGQVVGAYSVQAEHGFRDHGFVWADNVFTTFDPPGSVHTFPLSGINDAGQIVGLFDDASQQMQSFLGNPSPVPEPMAFWLMTIGVSGIVIGAKLTTRAR